jgi:hypothetical protein
VANGLWQKLENRHASNVANRENRDNNSSLLYQALMAGNNKGGGSSFASNAQEASDGFGGFAKLANTLKGSNSGSSNGISSFNIGSLGNLDGLGNLGAIGNAAGSLTGGSSSLPTTLGGASSGSAITDAITGAGGSGSAITDAINSNVGGSTASNSGGFFSKLKGGSGGGSSVPWAMIANVAKQGYNGISGHDDKEYSDVEESIIYPLQGAAMGASYSGGNPWAAAGGALYGLGYSFKDDLGMKDSNFLTQMLFPIGMGDGGGLKIGGKSVLDLG